MSEIHVVKTSGEREPLDLFKFQRYVAWGCEGVKNVSQSAIEINSQIEFYDGITTREIKDIILRSTVNLISEDTPEYQYVAAKFRNFDLRKQVYNDFNPWSWKTQVERGVAAGVYDRILLDCYTEAELAAIDKMIDHDRDWNFNIGGIEQTQKKYLVKDRSTGTLYETPQMMYMRIAASLLSIVEDKNERMEYIKWAYDSASQWYFSLPSPIMHAAGTPTRQFSSCVGIKVGDSLDSIIESGGHIVRYAARLAGIGFDIGMLRGTDASVRNGQAKSTGPIPFAKKLKGDLKSSAQGAMRGASATCYYPIWHWDYREMIVLKNNKGVEENRERLLDYGVQMNGYLMDRITRNESITLFSPEQVPDLYEAFFQDQPKFAELYEKYERARKAADGKPLRKKKVKAIDIGKMFVNERSDTGRIYPMFVDNCNEQGPFDKWLDTIYHSNLCAEIALPSKPFTEKLDESGRVFLCTLGSMNWGKFKDPKEMERHCFILVVLLNCLLDFQDYPTLQSRLATQEFRTLGIGMLNKAYFLAKRGLKYGEPAALAEVKRFEEHQSYYLTKASVDLAEKHGKCTKSDTTCYGQGVFPWEKRKPGVDALVDMTPDPTLPWEALRARMLVHGIRNGALQAQAPTETSAQPMGATNGIEPPQELISVKVSKDGIFVHVVPELKRLKNKYETKWKMKNCRGYLKSAAVMQAFMDQSLSTNTFYNPVLYGGKLKFSKLWKDIVDFYNWGGKTLYYHVNYDGDAESQKQAAPQAAAAPPDDSVCEACSV